jgi:hypothetical protein
VLVPVLQVSLAAHHPQFMLEVQLSQDEESLQGSVVPPEQALEYQAQSAQEPVDGPDREPVTQAEVERHQPQLACVVQSSQAVEPAQGSAGVDVEQASSVQFMPEQQSAVVAQMPEPDWQAQRPATHDIQPQQSVLVAQVPLASTQHWRSSGLARQLMPEQHSDAAAHVAPAGLQDEAGRAHWLEALHSRPVRHRSPLVQHGWASAPHAAAEQVESAQVPPVQRLPHVPQLRGSRVVSTQARSQHDRPVPVQLVPPQQGCPAAPQAAGAVWQVASVQTRPSLQAVPEQHGCRAPPHTGAVSQLPALHTRPDAQAVPPQQGWRRAPQASAVVHRSRSQTRPERQAVPEQHGWRSAPHAGSSAQRPEVQTNSAAHATPEQHGRPSRPQASTPLQVPDEHVRPGPQRVPSQQGSRSFPHRSAGVSAGGVTSRPPSSRRASRPMSTPESPPAAQPSCGPSAASTMNAPSQVKERIVTSLTANRVAVACTSEGSYGTPSGRRKEGSRSDERR